MNKKVLLKIEKIKKSYQNKTVLDIDSLSFESNKIYAIVGPNGSGKTTLINILNLLDKPDEGIIIFRGKDIRQYSKQDILKIRRRMTLVHQKPFLFQTSVFNNVAYGLKLRGIATENNRTKIMNSLSIVGLTDFDKRNAHQLSGGEAQRVVIARALALEPEILFLDEPTSNIDMRHIDVIERIIKEINQKMKTTVVFTTHDLSQAYRLADEIISLLDGKIVPHVPENIFKGRIVDKEGNQYFEIADNLRFSIVTKKNGLSYIYIDPRDIIISCKQFSSSALNSFYGKVTKISEQNKLIRLTIDIGVQL
ncbi:MAG: phosphate ABC transporter ATP-binding protein, partial [Candidatus Caldatribacteriota bacterium]